LDEKREEAVPSKEMFEKLNPSRPNDFRRIFLKWHSLKISMDAGFECSRGPIAGLGCTGMLPGRALDPEPSGYAEPAPEKKTGV
jgi:hypothetical protein